MSRRLRFALAACAGSLLVSPGAWAFCRATTCDPNDPEEHCQKNSQGCLETGKPLAWRSSCVTVGIQQMGSPRSGLGFDDIAPIVEQAFGAWMHADCGSAGPSIDVNLIGSIECGLSEYNQKAGNANVVIFRDDEWPHVGAGNAIGLTTTRFDKNTGELWDADIELNSWGAHLTIGDPVEGSDLLSVLTHEAGHFLGLGHSPDPESTMKLVYDPTIDGTSFRTLAADDTDGICTIYPPDRKPTTTSCVNRHGFSQQCGEDQPVQNESKGCSLNTRAVDTGNAASSLGWLATLGALCCARLARRRRIV